MSVLSEDNAADVLDDIQRSGVLGRSERQVALLEYLLKETAAGRGEAIKPYDIAVGIFGRGEDFDHSIDSIVRTEMYRLRQHLQAYNSADHTYQLTLPKASYQPILEFKKSEKLPAQAAGIGKKALITVLMSLLVILVPFAANKWLSGYEAQQADDTFAIKVKIEEERLSGEVPEQFYQGLNDYLYDGLIAHLFMRAGKLEAYDYLLTYRVFKSPDNKHYTLRMNVFSDDGSVVWSTSKQVDSNGAKLASRFAISQMLVPAFERPGPVYSDFLNRSSVAQWRKDMLLCANAGVVLTHYGRIEPPYEDEQALLKCLRPDKVKSTGDKADIHALRALIYLDAARGYNKLQADKPFLLASQEIREARQLSAFTYLSLRARMLLERERKPERDLRAVQDVLNDIETYLPRHYGLTADRSVTYGYMLGDWEKSADLGKWMLDQNAMHDSKHVQHHVLASRALVEGKPDEAADWADRIPDTNVPIYNIVRAAAYCQAGQKEKLKPLKQDFAEHGLETVEDYIAFVMNRRYEPGIEQALLHIAQRDNLCGLLDIAKSKPSVERSSQRSETIPQEFGVKVSPGVYLDYVISDERVSKGEFEDARFQIDSYLSSTPFVRKTNKGEALYRMTINITRSESDSELRLLISVFDGSQPVHTRIEHGDFSESGTLFFAFAEIFGYNGIIATLVLQNKPFPEADMATYRCKVLASRLIYRHKIPASNEEILACLSKTDQLGIEDRAMFLSLRASLALLAYRGTIDLDIEQPFESAESWLDEAASLGRSEFRARNMYYTSRYILEWERRPISRSNLLGLRKTILQKKYPSLSFLDYYHATSLGTLLGEWEEANVIIARQFQKPEYEDSYALLALQYQLVKKDYDSAIRIVERVPERSGKIWTAHVAALYCLTKSDALKGLLKDKILQYELQDPNKLAAFLASRQYEPGLKQSLLDAVGSQCNFDW